MSHNLDTHVFEELSDSNEALLRELEIVRQERDALAALCQEAAAVLERTANDTLDGRNTAVRLRESSASLARLKAQCWKEAYLAGMETGHHWTVEGGYVAGGDEEAAEDYVADRQAEEK